MLARPSGLYRADYTVRPKTSKRPNRRAGRNRHGPLARLARRRHLLGRDVVGHAQTANAFLQINNSTTSKLATAGGADVAWLYDSHGDDTFDAGPNSSTLSVLVPP